MTREAPVRLGTIRDDRGRSVALLDPMADWAAGRHDRIRKEVLDSIIRELSGGHLPSRRLIVGGAIAVAGMILLAAAAIGLDIYHEGAAAAADLRRSLFITVPAVVPMLIAAIVVPVLAARRKRLAAARDALLRHSTCPHCGYDLSGARSDGGAAVCPECGCAWRIPARHMLS
ncbi:MAG: hypothetical protein IT436_08910 [Phycisphaerales bacterium]|nr:hypothetical protein [Phycisphaerales bacterium]